MSNTLVSILKACEQNGEHKLVYDYGWLFWYLPWKGRQIEHVQFLLFVIIIIFYFVCKKLYIYIYVYIY